MRHDLEQMLRQARSCGWQVTQPRRGHWRRLHPGGGIVVASSSPSDYRALANLKAQLRRAEHGHARPATPPGSSRLCSSR